MNLITPQDKFQIRQILIKSSQLQTADDRRNFLKFCDLDKYAGLIQLGKPLEQFAISLIATLSLVSLSVDNSEKNGLVFFLEHLNWSDSSLSEDDQKFIQQLITRTSHHHHQAQGFSENLGYGVTQEMVAIPPGIFLMGSPDTEEGRQDNERPQHYVSVDSFFMGKYPVIQAQWYVVAAHFPQVNCKLDPDPSHFKGVNRPVECVSWDDAVEFCARLSRKTGRDYRLPTEAEWEYACRAGTTTPFHFGETITPELANYDANHTYGAGSKGKYRKETTDVGSFQIANAFGLYDMHGNVWEWCADYRHKNYQGAPSDGKAWLSDNDNQYRLLRGGSWYDNPENCRSAFRYVFFPGVRGSIIGFRVVCAAARTL